MNMNFRVRLLSCHGQMVRKGVPRSMPSIVLYFGLAFPLHFGSKTLYMEWPTLKVTLLVCPGTHLCRPNSIPWYLPSLCQCLLPENLNFIFFSKNIHHHHQEIDRERSMFLSETCWNWEDKVCVFYFQTKLGIWELKFKYE